jgi:signal recognition particle subunit SRP54
MFGALTEKFKNLWTHLAGQKKLTEENISDAVRQVRLALLDADVNYTVVSDFVRRVKEKALGDSVIKAVAPGEQFIQVVHGELVALMGGEEATFELKGSPSAIMLCGLQGSGKTTTAAKLAHFVRKKGKKTLVVACDLQRPAAILQLEQLCAKIEVPLFTLPGETNPCVVAEKAMTKARAEGFEVVIVDTAGRLHLDAELMEQLAKLKKIVAPHEVLFVANSSTGQDAVTVAAEFDKQVELTGTILTMLDGSARAGAAISIREVTKKPLKFEGVGEKIEDLQPFNPSSMADRILGMGDVVNLVRKAKEQFDEKEGEKLEEKLRKATFTFDDYLQQMKSIKRMGPLKGLLQMIPGASELANLDKAEDEFKKTEAIISSMTPAESCGKAELVPPRRWRIAKGSGTTIDDVNRLIKKFKQMKDLFKNMPKKGMMDLFSMR